MFDPLNLDRLSVHSIYERFRYSTDTDTISDVSADGYFDVSKFDTLNTSPPIVECICIDGTVILAVDESTLKSSVLYRGDTTIYISPYRDQVLARRPQDLQNIDSTKVYFIDGIIDFTGSGLNIEVPAGGITLNGHGTDISQIICHDDNYTLFTSPIGGSGNVFKNGIAIQVDGTNSKVRDLVSVSGFEAIECERVNYNNCTALGVVDNYRQGLEINTGRFGGTPELTMKGNWIGGYRISTSIVRGLSDLTALFKADNLTIGGRFITDINCDLPAVGALFDFSESNITNDESLIVDGAYITRQGVINASDTTIYPNINHESVKSNWGNNTGMPNTTKYIKAVCTAEVATALSGVAVDTYLPLLGTFTVSKAVQFSMPANGEFQLLTGNGVYQFVGTIQVKGTAGDLVDLRITKSTDSGSTYPTEINHIQLEIANLSGPTDFATYSVNFIESLKKGDRIRLEVENKTASRDVTMSAQSFLIITEV